MRDIGQSNRKSKFSDTYIHVRWKVNLRFERGWCAMKGTLAPIYGHVTLYFDKRREKNLPLVHFVINNDQDNPLGIENKSIDPNIQIVGNDIWDKVLSATMREIITCDLRNAYIRKRKKIPYIADPSTRRLP